jgi:hypothetical protein
VQERRKGPAGRKTPEGDRARGVSSLGWGLSKQYTAEEHKMLCLQASFFSFSVLARPTSVCTVIIRFRKRRGFLGPSLIQLIVGPR